MVMKTTSALMISMVIMASLSALSQALILNGLQVSAIRVTDTLHCSLNGDLNAPLLSGVTVHLVCDNEIAVGTTNQAGVFNIVTGILGITDIKRCCIRINLPVASCSLFGATGVAIGSLSLLNVVPSTVGNVASLVLSGPLRLG